MHAKCPPTFHKSKRLLHTCSKLVHYEGIPKTKACPSGTHRSKRIQGRCSAIVRRRLDDVPVAWGSKSRSKKRSARQSAARRSKSPMEVHESPVMRILSINSNPASAKPAKAAQRSPQALFRLPPMRTLRRSAGRSHLRTAWA